MNPSRVLVSTALLLAAAGCVVVPVDPRTGQPYPVARHDHGPGQPPAVTVVTPPASSGPAQPHVLSARLYPLNSQANLGGMLTAVVVDHHTCRGSFTLGYRGDSLQGEATRVDAAYGGFGRVHQDVLGQAPRPVAGRRGIANAYGAKGVNVQCEYVVTGPTMGTGVCRFSDGAHYQMHFGA